MPNQRCPGLDSQYWKPEDVFDVVCPSCGGEVEFCKDEPVRTCSNCRSEVRNPRLDLACAKWCAQSEKCLGILKGTRDPSASSAGDPANGQTA